MRSTRLALIAAVAAVNPGSGSTSTRTKGPRMTLTPMSLETTTWLRAVRVATVAGTVLFLAGRTVLRSPAAIGEVGQDSVLTPEATPLSGDSQTPSV